VINFSTCTEPPPPILAAPVNPAVNEPPQLTESEEHDEPSAFAKILAGLLGKTEVNNEEAVDSSDLSSIAALEDLSDQIDSDLKLSLLGAYDKKDEPAEISENDLSDVALSNEQMSMILSAEHLLIRSGDQDADKDGDFSQKLINVKDIDLLANGELEDASSLVKSIKPDTITEVKTAADDANFELKKNEIIKNKSEEALAGETGKNDRIRDFAQLKNENNESKTQNEGSRSGQLASLRTEPKNESPGRLDEMRNRSRRDRIAFNIHDMRSADTRFAGMSFNAGADVTTGRMQQTSFNEITLELRLPNHGQNASPNMQAQTTWETRAGTALENMLARELHQNFNGDIVRHASMALRDGGSGTIKLALRPESLGNVKIHLEMTENKITGIIVVESEEALNAFKKELSSLQQAFKDAGYESADLNLSLTADDRGEQGQAEDANHLLQQSIALRYEDGSFYGEEQDLTMMDVFPGQKSGAINMLA
jgi:flagellar hook-length control protein FliK